MALHIVIDARRIRDFGIGTYIRSLVHALSAIDATNHYTLVSGPATCARWPGCRRISAPPSTRATIPISLDHLAFPLFLRGLSPDLVHIPLNRVPLLMIRPYVVTIHDMANLFFEEAPSDFRMQLRRFRFRRGLVRASRVIAVSDATRRDVESLLGVPLATHPPRLQRARPGLPRRAALRAGSEEQLRIHGALPDRLPVPAVRRQHPPPQEHAAPGGGVRGGARATGRAPGLQGPAAGDHRRHDLAVSRRCGRR